MSTTNRLGWSAAAALLLTVPASAQGTSFGLQQIVATGLPQPQGYECVETADIDGDGDLDLVSSSLQGGTVAWYENLGQNSAAFGPASVISSTFSYAITVHAEDLDGDGDLDLLATSATTNRVGWFENLGGGAFAAVQLLAYTAGSVPYDVTTADLDGDGLPDVLASYDGSDEIVWWQNNGGGSFTTGVRITNLADRATSVFAADLDGDGDLDVLSASGNDDKIAWYENLTLNSGTFGPQKIITTNANGAYSVHAADLDGDGAIDVLSASEIDNRIAWYRNSGGGVGATTFTSSTIANDAMQAFCVEASDLDGDGDQDVLSASFADNRVAWYENDGNGVFSAARDITTKAEGVSIATAADLDGDGDLDVASASYRQDLGNPGVFTEKVAYYLNNGGAPFSGQQLVSTAADGAWSVHAADLDGDGDRDLLSASISDGEIAWYAFDGAGGFGPQQVIGAHVDGARDVFAADLDADSDLDVVACFNSSTGNVIRTYENLGGGLFAAPETVATGLPGPRSVHAADLDFDGDSDIAYTAANGNELGWLRNNGDGTWTRAVLSSGVSGAEGLHAADLDFDGDLDLITAAPGANRVYWHRNDGGGAFAGEQVVSSSAQGAWSVYAADLDGDGDNDILSASVNDDEVVWYENLGAGSATWGPERLISGLTNNPRSVQAADFDVDGDLDVVVASELDNRISWFSNDGTGTFGARQVITTDARGARSVFAGDIDCDGAPDVASASATDDKVAWHRNQMTPYDCNGNGVPDSADVLSGFAQDCNGNGVPDSCDINLWACSQDCNLNGVPDECDISNNPGIDCDQNGLIDLCEAPSDCNSNGIIDACDIFSGTSGDCNTNGIPDDCDIGAFSTSLDCDANGVPDECEPDCNGNGITDACDLSSGAEQDCDGSGVPDSCELDAGLLEDCDGNGQPDVCDLAVQPSLDCDQNGLLDVCDIAADPGLDCDASGTLDSCELIVFPGLDCDGNGIIDGCDIAADGALDCNGNGALDACEIVGDPGLDCDGNGVIDTCELDGVTDCDSNSLIDSCEIAANPQLDLNNDGILDACQCATPVNYCQTSANTFSSGAVMAWRSVPSVAANQFEIGAFGVPPGKLGLFFYGAQTTLQPFGEGFRCVGGQIFRLDPPGVAAPTGELIRRLDFNAFPMNSGPGKINPGSTWNFQLWYRDPAGGFFGFNLSDGLRVTFCP